MGKMKFGDGSTNFKRNKFSEHNVDAEGPMRYASPVKQGFMDMIGGDGLGGENKNKDLKPPSSDKKPIVIDESKTEKVKPQEIKRTDTGETTNTSSRPEDNATPEQRMGSDYVTKTPEEAGMHEVKKQQEQQAQPPLAAEKPEKKGLWQRFKDHHDSGEAMKVEAHFKDAAAVIAGDGRKDGSDLHKQYDQNIKDKKTSQLATKAKADQDAKDAINAKQKEEMHKSQLAVNEQNINASKALEEQRKSNVKIQEEANAGEGEVESTEPTAPTIITNTANAESTINDENKKKQKIEKI